MIAVREAWHVARMTNTIASHALAVAVASEADQVPEWVQIFPAGPDLPARDGRRFTLHDPQAVIAASMDTSVDLMVDVEHASETRPKQGLDAPAVGWIKALEERAGAIWGRVEWTTQGREWVASRAYRYFSPTLAATASAADAVTAIATLKGEVQTATARANSPDPAQYVAKAQYDATAAKLAEATAALEAQEAAKFEAAVDAGVDAGKIMPAARDNYLAMARSIGLEAFGQQLDAMPKIVGAADTKDAPATAQAGLSAEDRLVANAFDMSETDFAQAKK